MPKKGGDAPGDGDGDAGDGGADTRGERGTNAGCFFKGLSATLGLLVIVSALAAAALFALLAEHDVNPEGSSVFRDELIKREVPLDEKIFGTLSAVCYIGICVIVIFAQVGWQRFLNWAHFADTFLGRGFLIIFLGVEVVKTADTLNYLGAEDHFIHPITTYTGWGIIGLGLCTFLLYGLCIGTADAKFRGSKPARILALLLFLALGFLIPYLAATQGWNSGKACECAATWQHDGYPYEACAGVPGFEEPWCVVELEPDGNCTGFVLGVRTEVEGTPVPGGDPAGSPTATPVPGAKRVGWAPCQLAAGVTPTPPHPPTYSITPEVPYPGRDDVTVVVTAGTAELQSSRLMIVPVVDATIDACAAGSLDCGAAGIVCSSPEALNATADELVWDVGVVSIPFGTQHLVCINFGEPAAWIAVGQPFTTPPPPPTPLPPTPNPANETIAPTTPSPATITPPTSFPSTLAPATSLPAAPPSNTTETFETEAPEPPTDVPAVSTSEPQTQAPATSAPAVVSPAPATAGPPTFLPAPPVDNETMTVTDTVPVPFTPAPPPTLPPTPLPPGETAVPPTDAPATPDTARPPTLQPVTAGPPTAVPVSSSPFDTQVPTTAVPPGATTAPSTVVPPNATAQPSEATLAPGAAPTTAAPSTASPAVTRGPASTPTPGNVTSTDTTSVPESPAPDTNETKTADPTSEPATMEPTAVPVATAVPQQGLQTAAPAFVTGVPGSNAAAACQAELVKERAGCAVGFEGEFTILQNTTLEQCVCRCANMKWCVALLFAPGDGGCILVDKACDVVAGTLAVDFGPTAGGGPFNAYAMPEEGGSGAALAAVLPFVVCSLCCAVAALLTRRRQKRSLRSKFTVDDVGCSPVPGIPAEDVEACTSPEMSTEELETIGIFSTTCPACYHPIDPTSDRCAKCSKNLSPQASTFTLKQRTAVALQSALDTWKGF